MDQREPTQMQAMHEAIKRAEEAAEQRRLAKLQAAQQAPAFELDLDDDWQVIEATRVQPAEPEPAPAAPASISLGAPIDLDQVLRELDAAIPDLPGHETDGDLVVMRHDERAQAWYELAAEAAMPEAIRGIVGPVDVKALLQALIVEVGDVKRTNAILMEIVTRLEEKVDRTNRLLRERKYH